MTIPFPAVQLDMFNERTDIAFIKEDVLTLHAVVQNVRKGLFARHNQLVVADAELFNKIEDLQEQIYKLREMMIKEKK